MPTRKAIEQLLLHFQVPKIDHTYVLGLFEPRITVASQQVRAINLVKALFESERLRSEQRLVVVGAGVGGLTVAAAAAERGAIVTILEKEANPLSILSHNRTRWLFPYRYEWPDPGWEEDNAKLEVLSWGAGQVQSVVRHLLEEWRTVRDRTRIEEHYKVEQVAATYLDQRRPFSVSWVSEGSARRTAAHAIVYAVGFGKEHRAPGMTSTYWDNDNFDLAEESHEPHRYLVSGNGDGALVDALRIRLRFEQQHFFTDFFEEGYLDAVAQEVRDIEVAVRAQVIKDARAKAEGREPESWAWLTERYLAIKSANLIDGKLKSKLREGTQVVLNGLTEKVLSPSAFPINRLLISRFFKNGRDWGMQYVRGPLELPDEFARSYFIPNAHPQGLPFHQVLWRRGPIRPRPLERDFQEVHRLAVVEPALAEGDGSRNRNFWGDAPSRVHTVERTVEDLALALEETRDLVAAMGCLLRTCHQEQVELARVLYTKGGDARWRALHKQARTEFRGWAETLQPEKAKQLATFVRTHAPASQLVIVARALADALDSLYGPRFLDIFKRSHELRGIFGKGPFRVEIRPLEVFPLPNVSTSISARAERHGNTWDAGATRYLRLGSPLFGRTLLEVQRYVDLAVPDQGLLGVVVPAHARDLTWQVQDRVLLSVEPKDSKAFAKTLEELLTQAIARQARVLVLPELVCSPEVVEDVFRIVTTHRATKHQLVVAVGSHHYDEGYPDACRKHRSMVLVAGSLSEQGKAIAGSFCTPDGHHCGESIAAGDALVVHAARGGSLAVALGSDLGHRAAHLKWLSPSLVLVPACAVPDGRALRQQATDLAHATCATVVVGHLSTGEPGAEAFVHSLEHAERAARADPPVLFLTEPGTRKISSSFPPDFQRR
jgi:predicted amidohydrolase